MASSTKGSKRSKIIIGIIVACVVIAAMCVGGFAYADSLQKSEFNQNAERYYQEQLDAMAAFDQEAEDPHAQALQALGELQALQSAEKEAFLYADGSEYLYDLYTDEIQNRINAIIEWLHTYYSEQAAPYLAIDIASTDRDTLAASLDALNALNALIAADNEAFPNVIWSDASAYDGMIQANQTQADAVNAQIAELDRIAAEEEAARQAAAAATAKSSSSGKSSGSYSGGGSSSGSSLESKGYINHGYFWVDPNQKFYSSSKDAIADGW